MIKETPEEIMVANTVQSNHLNQVLRGDLISILKEHICKISFTKLDGTVRVMKCTLKEGLLPIVSDEVTTDIPKPKKKTSSEVIVVFDLEKKGWRSFRVDSYLDMEEVG